MKCPVCSKQYSDSFVYCPYCGTKKPEGPLVAGEEVATSPDVEKVSTVSAPSELVAKAREQIGWVPIIAIVIAFVGLVGWVLAGVFLGTEKSSDEADTEAVAETLIDNLTDENYEAIFEQLDMSNPQLLSLLLSETTEREPADIFIIEDEEELRENRAAMQIAEDFFSEFRPNLLKSNIKSLDSRKLVEGEDYVVAVYTFDSEDAFPVMMVNTDDGWKIDYAALLTVSNRGLTSQYVIDSVNTLLLEPNVENTEQAIEILESTDGLEEKYDLWLQPEAIDLVPEEIQSGMKEGKQLTPEFEPLLETAKEARDEATGDTPDKEPEPTPTPTEPEVRTLTGNGSGVTQRFELREGLVIFHFDYRAGGNFVVSLLDDTGQEVNRLVEASGTLAGSTAVGVRNAVYSFDVQAFGPWTIGIEEPQPVAAPFPPQYYTGNGPRATDFFQTKGGPVTLNMDNKSSGNFVVTVMEEGGNAVFLAANVSGPYQCVCSVSLRSDINYLLNVQAEGLWSIEVTEPVE